jgi:hypothetical protein
MEVFKEQLKARIISKQLEQTNSLFTPSGELVTLSWLREDVRYQSIPESDLAFMLLRWQRIARYMGQITGLGKAWLTEYCITPYAETGGGIPVGWVGDTQPGFQFYPSEINPPHKPNKIPKVLSNPPKS